MNIICAHENFVFLRLKGSNALNNNGSILLVFSVGILIARDRIYEYLSQIAASIEKGMTPPAHTQPRMFQLDIGAFH